MPDQIRAVFEQVASGLERHGCDVRQALGLPVGADMASDDSVAEAIRNQLVLLAVERARLQVADESARIWRGVAERFERGELVTPKRDATDD